MSSLLECKKVFTNENRDRLMKEGFTLNQAVLILALISHGDGLIQNWEILDEELNKHRMREMIIYD